MSEQISGTGDGGQQRATGVGATGGLPGANADPRTSELAPEELESTVARGDVAGDAVPDVADQDQDLSDASDEELDPDTER